MAGKTEKKVSETDTNVVEKTDPADTSVNDSPGIQDANNAGTEQGGENNPDDSDSDESDLDSSKNETVVPSAVLNRKAVVFLGPHHRYSRKDIACFDSEHAEELVERGIAVWPDDAVKALAPRPGDDKYETDIG